MRGQVSERGSIGELPNHSIHQHGSRRRGRAVLTGYLIVLVDLAALSVLSPSFSGVGLLALGLLLIGTVTPGGNVMKNLQSFKNRLC